MDITFSILTSDRLTATIRHSLAFSQQKSSFQYPDLGSFDCNSDLASTTVRREPPFSILTSDRLTATMDGRLWQDLRPATFSILTSDRLTATLVRQLAQVHLPCFQYPDLGSFDCNKDALISNIELYETFSILTSDRLTATRGRHRLGGGVAGLSVS